MMCSSATSKIISADSLNSLVCSHSHEQSNKAMKRLISLFENRENYSRIAILIHFFLPFLLLGELQFYLIHKHLFEKNKQFLNAPNDQGIFN